MDYQYILMAILLSCITAIVPMLYLFIKIYIKKSNLSFEKQKIELEMFRKSLENSIYSTTDKIVSNRERWEDVNHMIFEAARKNIHDVDIVDNQFLKSLSIQRQLIDVNHNKAFLLAPINPRFEHQVNVIKSACNDIGVICETADEKYISGPILSVIVKKILSANLVIGVIDGRNPNVFYELGLAQAFGKTVVMISGGVDDIPFDIQSQRIIVVDWNNSMSVEKIRKSLAESMLWTNKKFQ